MSKFNPQVGDTIIFRKEICEGPCEEHPGYQFCKEGDFGWIGKITNTSFLVCWERWQSAAFRCDRDEFWVVGDGEYMIQPELPLEI